MNRMYKKRVTRLWIEMSLIVVVGMLLSGCVVSQKKYKAAVADMEFAKMDLEKNRMAWEAVGQNSEKLKHDNEQLAMDLELMTLTRQRLQENLKHEQDLFSARESEIEKQSQMVMVEYETLQQNYQKLISQNRALEKMVQRYQQEKAKQALEDFSTARSPKVTPSATKVVVASQSKPVMSSGMTPIKKAHVPVNINMASVNDLVLVLGVTKGLADTIIANRPYRLRGELVARQIISKATFNGIREKMTAVWPQ